MSHTAVCVAPAPEQLTTIIGELRQAGFTAEEIAITRAGAGPLVRLRRALVVSTGLGAALAVLTTCPPCSAAVLGSPLITAVAGGLLGALIACARHSRARRDDHVLISVQTTNGYEVETIIDIFRAAGAAHRTWSSR